MFKKTDLNNKIFIGVVENVYDEERKGRIQVRVQSLFNNIPSEHIPWAEPQRSLDGKKFSVPAVGKIVNIIFNNGNIYEPQYIYSENYNGNLQDKLNEMSDEEYENFNALLFDHRTQIYSDDTGICLDFSNNRINVNHTDIDIHLKDNDQLLHLGHEMADQSAMLGDHFLEWFDGFMQTLLNPSSLIGNIGAPVLKPQVDSEIMKYQLLRQSFLSEHVKVVDNYNCLKTNYDSERFSAPAQDDVTLLNDDKILKSVLVDDEIQKKIMEKRERDVDELIENEQNPNDIQQPDELNVLPEEPDDQDWEDSGNELKVNEAKSIKESLATQAEIDEDDDENIEDGETSCSIF